MIWRIWQLDPARLVRSVILLWLAATLDVAGLSTVLPLLEKLLSPAGLTRDFWFLEGVRPSLFLLLVVIVLAFTAKAAARWLAMRQVAAAVAGIAQQLREELLTAIAGANWRFFVQTPAGQLSSAAGMEATSAAFAFRRACGCLAAGLQLCMYLGLILLISPITGLLALAIGATIAGCLRVFVQASRAAGKVHTQAMRRLMSRLTDLVRALKPARSMGRDQALNRRLLDPISDLHAAELRQIRANEGLNVVQEPLVVLAVVGTLYTATVFAGVSTATVLTLGVVLYRALRQIHTIQLEYQGMAWSEAAWGSIREQIRMAQEAAEVRSGAQRPPRLEDALVLQDISFSYDGVTAVLLHLSLRIPARSLVLIHGPSGTGKTTLFDLLVRLHSPQSGTITVDGQPVHALDLSTWRKRVGYVSQEAALLHDTILHNLTFGEPVAMESVERALEIANATEFVHHLPDGLHTIVGEQGYRLSGGQRQRLALARALVGGPDLLLLDEATANVDPESERAIAAALERLKGELTIVVASHRPIFERSADFVYELKAGLLTEAAVYTDA